jgi:flagellar motor protein MotB
MKTMTKIKTLALALANASLLGAADPAPRQGQPPVQPAAQENLGDVEVTGQARDKVIIQKLEPEIKIDPKDLVDSVTDKTEKLLDKAKPVPAEEDFQQFNRLTSAQTARPWLPDFSEPPLINFLPAPSPTTVVSWRLEVTDEKGEIIQTLSGKGNPVREILWDGLDRTGKIIKVASAYSYRFVTVDEFKNAHTTIGKAFTLRHLKYREKGALCLEISNDLLFNGEALRPEGIPFLEKAMDVLREYSKYPFAVEFHTDNPKGDLVKKRQRQVTERMAKEMLMLPEDVRYTYPKIQSRGDVTRFVIRLR